MTLYAIIEKLKMLALKHPNVNSAYEGNIYDIMNANPEQKYASVVLTQQSHTQDDTYDHYGFNLFYVDRLVDNMDDNRVQIQSTGKSMLSNIIKAFCEEFDAECETINYQTFTERFADECAGVYCTITIDMVKDIYCTEKYWDESWATPLITVRNQNKSVEFTANGTYTVTYDATNYSGLGKVEVEVNVPDLNGSYDEGYSEGKEDGIQEGYADGKQDGYTEGFDTGKNQGLEEGYADGKADGIEEGYSQGKTDGFNEGKAEGYTEGKEDGISEQKAKLEGITITVNGTYTKEDGYNNIVVEIADTNGSYDEGYDDGYSEGIEEGTSNAGAIIAETAQVLNITENGVYATKYSKNEDSFEEIPTSEGNLIRTVNVNVNPNISPLEYSLNFGGSTFTSLPSIFKLPSRIDTTKLEGLFNNCKNLTDISCFDGVEEFYWTKTFTTYQSVLYRTFQYCEKLEDISPLRNIRLYVDDNNFTSAQKTAKFVFNYAFQKTAVTDFTPLKNIFDNITRDYTFEAGAYTFASSAIKRFELDWDWSKCTTYYQMLGDMKTIEYIQELDATSVTSGYNPLDVLSIISGTADALTYFGGFRNQKMSATSNYFLSKCPNLTYESCISILNNLYDFTGNGETPTSNQGKLKVHSNFLTTVGDELSIGTDKGWKITA